MRNLLILAVLVGVANARPGYLGLGQGTRSNINTPLSLSTLISEGIYSTLASARIPIPRPAPVEISNQYHVQDEQGQYAYGYAAGPSAKNEIKTSDGVTQGGYSYIDANGHVQSVTYMADSVHGFRVAATNLPVAPKAIPPANLFPPSPIQDTPEVAAAKIHLAAYDKTKAAADAAPEVPRLAEGTATVDPAEPSEDEGTPASTELLPPGVLTREVEEIPYLAMAYGGYGLDAYSLVQLAQAIEQERLLSQSSSPFDHLTYSTNAPTSHHSPTVRAPQVATPVASQATPVEVSSQYHAQDEIGQYIYGYSGGPSTKREVKTADGITRGEFSYIDGYGKVQTVHYMADPINGFRVLATNLPAAQNVPAVPALRTVRDTAEVATAKAEHLAAVQEAKARLKPA